MSLQGRAGQNYLSRMSLPGVDELLQCFWGLITSSVDIWCGGIVHFGRSTVMLSLQCAMLVRIGQEDYHTVHMSVCCTLILLSFGESMQVCLHVIEYQAVLTDPVCSELCRLCTASDTCGIHQLFSLLPKGREPPTLFQVLPDILL